MHITYLTIKYNSLLLAILLSNLETVVIKSINTS